MLTLSTTIDTLNLSLSTLKLIGANNLGTSYDGNSMQSGLYSGVTFSDLTTPNFAVGHAIEVVGNPSVHATSELYGLLIENATAGTKDFIRLEGADISSRHQGSGTASSLVGATLGSFIGYPSGGGPVTEAYGGRIKVSHWGSSTVGAAYGVDARVNAAAMGGITSAKAIQVTLTSTGGGTIGAGYGVYVANPTISGVGSAITANYGIYLEPQTAGTTNHAIYSAGGPSYLAGAVKTGTAFEVGTNPATVGHLRLPKNFAIYSRRQSNDDDDLVVSELVDSAQLVFGNTVSVHRIRSAIALGAPSLPNAGDWWVEEQQNGGAPNRQCRLAVVGSDNITYYQNIGAAH